MKTNLPNRIVVNIWKYVSMPLCITATFFMYATSAIAHTTTFNYSGSGRDRSGGGGSYNSVNKADTRSGNGLVTTSVMQATSGAAINFDGYDDYLRTTSPFYQYTNSITVEAWVNTTQSVWMGQSIADWDDWSSSNVWLWHIKQPGQGMDWLVNDAGTIRSISLNTLASGWHHIATVANSCGMFIYVDGVLTVSSSTGISSGIKNVSNSIIDYGKDPRYSNVISTGTSRYTAFSIDEVRIWSRPLSVNEIQAHKDCELTAGQMNGLQEYYQFNQGLAGGDNTSITSVTDVSGNGRNASINNLAMTGSTSNFIAPGGVTTGSNCSPFSLAAITGNAPVRVGNTITLADATPGGTWSSSAPAVASVNASGLVTGLSSGTTVISYTIDCGTAATVTVVVAATPATSLNFDGVDDYVSINNPYTAFNKEITVEFWMNPASANLPFGSVMGQGTSNVEDWAATVWLMHPNLNGTMTFYVNDAGNNARTAQCNLIAGSWHHYAGVASATSTKIYVDGVLVATGPGISNTIMNNNSSVIHIGKDVRFNIGKPYDIPRYANMSIDEVRIWNRALCQDEIVNTMNCEASSQTGLQELYHFNQGTVNANNTGITTLTDASGNNRNGVLNNFALTGAASNWVASGSTNTGTCAVYVAPTAPITGTTSLCLGATSSLSNTITGGTWSSSNTAVATINASGVVTALSAGTSTITYTTNCGGVSTVTVTVNGAPVITLCPANVTVNATPGQCGAIVNYTAAAASGNPNPVITYSQASGTFFNVGTTTVTVTATNSCGSSSICSFTVTVTDTEKPAFMSASVQGTRTITIPYGGNTNGWSPWVYSFADPLPAGAVVTGVDLTYTAVDQGWGGTGAPSDMYVSGTYIGSGQLLHYTQTFNLSKTTSFPNYVYGGTNTLKMYFWGYPGWVAYWQGGTLTIHYQVPPASTVPAAISVNNDAGKCGAVVMLTVPAAADNCGVQSVTNDAPGVFPVGTTTVTWTATDIHGNTNTATQTVTVIDNEKPSITAPANIAVNNDAGQCGATVNIGAPVTSDNCGVASVVNDHASATYPVGTTTVTWTVTDIHGNTNTATQTVTVTDNEKPSITAPANIAVNNDAGKCSATVNLGTPVTSDNCGVASVVNDHASTTYPVGTTVVNWMVTDIHGNSSSTTQAVVVTDNEKPNVITKAVSVTLVNGVVSINAAMVDGGSTDNCGIASLSVSPSIFHCADIGGNTVTLTVIDIHGNVSTGTALVTVVGEIPGCSIKSMPTSNVYTGGNPNNLYLGYGAQSTTLQVTPAAVSGNGGPGYTYIYSWSGNGVTMLSSTTSGAPVFTPTKSGFYTFTVVTTNNYGCSTTCTIGICVTDIRVPGTNGSKVYLCHLPPGNTGNPQTLSISVNAVPAHLVNHAGDRLGSCDQVPCGTVALTSTGVTSTFVSKEGKGEATSTEEDLKVTVMPNPSATIFALKLESRYATPVNMRIMDANGRVIDAKSGIASNSTIQIGHNYSSGIYYAELIQGDKRKVVQLIKGK